VDVDALRGGVDAERRSEVRFEEHRHLRSAQHAARVGCDVGRCSRCGATVASSNAVDAGRRREVSKRAMRSRLGRMPA
jgi:uncharacterized Fe-S cluster-containing radical SAM superfamily protein